MVEFMRRTSSISVSTKLRVFPLTFLTRFLAGLLESVLFANLRFHDTISRGRLLNRFGKDFEGELRS